MGLTDEHFQILSVAFAHHPSLNTLVLSSNVAGVLGLMALQEMMEKNYILCYLLTDVHDNSIRAALDLFLLLNRHGREKLLLTKPTTVQTDPLLRREWLFFVVERFHDNLSAIFWLLREQPDIWKG